MLVLRIQLKSQRTSKAAFVTTDGLNLKRAVINIPYLNLYKLGIKQFTVQHLNMKVECLHCEIMSSRVVIGMHISVVSHWHLICISNKD